MLQRKMHDNLLKWNEDSKKKALLITGARQTGKTFLIRAFAKANYENFVEINFINEPKAEAIFAGNLDAETLAMNMTAFTRMPMIPGKITYLPWYMILFLKHERLPEHLTVNLDLSGLTRDMPR